MIKQVRLQAVCIVCAACVGFAGGVRAESAVRVTPLPPGTWQRSGSAPGWSAGSLADPVSMARMRQALSGSLVGGAGLARPVAALPGKPGAAVGSGMAQLRLKAGTGVRVRIRPQTGTPAEMGGGILEEAGNALRLSALAPGLEIAGRFLQANRDLLRLEDPAAELLLVENVVDVLGRRHLRFQQRYGGLEVWPGELSVHLNPVGEVDRMNGAYIPTPRWVGLDPELGAGEAVLRARHAIGVGGDILADEPELIVYGPLEGPPALAWKFELTLAVYDVRVCVVDAMTGDLLLEMSRICHAAEAGSGLDSLGLTRALDIWNDGGTYLMVDASKPMYDATSVPPDLEKIKGGIVILDARNTPATSDPQQVDQLFHSTSSSATSGWVPDAVSAAFGLSQTYDYYRQAYGRNSLDGKGGTIIGIVRFGVKFPNAFWSGKAMFFGDNFTRSIDVTGHELTHGVISNTGDGGILTYHNQPGALNESMADIFGEMVEHFTTGSADWLKGDELEGDPIQNYADPNTLKQGPYTNPARMSQFVQLPDSPQGDNGGVHINSSIINHAFWYLAVGGPQAVGVPDASQIFYRAMTTHLQKESQFIDMRHACLASAEELFGTGAAQVASTSAAFDWVEIFDAPAPKEPAPLPQVDAPDAAFFLSYLYDDFWQVLDGPYLVRKDPSLGDPGGGVVMNTWKYPAQSRVSVTGDGSYTIYVTEDFDLGFIETADSEGQTADWLGVPGSIWSVAMSPDGQRYAFVLLDESGRPTSQITVYDYPTDSARSLDLYVPLMDGERLDIVQFADAMAFLPDGNTLVYDAYSEFRTGDGSIVGSWTLFAMDLETGKVVMLIDLSEGMDFANPSLGRVRSQLLAFEVIDKATGRSEVYAANLQTGQTERLDYVGDSGDLGYPCYLGDDSAIVYTIPDPNTWTGYSLAISDVGADGITPAGNPALWIQDGGIGVVFRRGEFVSVNHPPEVSLGSPAAGQTLEPPASVELSAQASDPDGSVAKVEFFIGSELLAADTTVPYGITVSGIPEGEWRFVARATDALGAVTDSVPINVRVAAQSVAPEIGGVRLTAGGALEFEVAGLGVASVQLQASADLVVWTTVQQLAVTNGRVVFSEVVSGSAGPRFYRIAVP